MSSDSDTAKSFSQLPPSIARFCLLLSCFECPEVPVALFSRACSPQPKWTSAGTIAHRVPSESLVPAWLSAVCFDISSARKNPSKGVLQAIQLGIFTLGSHGNTQHFKIAPGWKEYLRGQLRSQELAEHLFDGLAIIIQAFPDSYAELLWEEVEFQLWEVVMSTFLPFLGVISEIDLEEYLSFQQSISSRRTPDVYLSNLFRFLIRISCLMRPNTPMSITSNITAVDRMIGAEATKMHSDAAYYSLVLRTQEMIGLSNDSHAPDLLLRQQECEYGSDERSNSCFGLALDAVSSSSDRIPFNKHTAALKASWRPYSMHRLSPMEHIAAAALLSGSATETLLDSLSHNVDLNVKVQAGFCMARRQLFRLAKTLLEQCITEVEEKYGNQSAELYITKTELIKCCNLIGEGIAGAEWAGMDYGQDVEPFIYADYLQTALADSHICRADYVGARKLLEEITLKPSATDSLRTLAALRLAKLERIEGKTADIFSEGSALEKAFSHFDTVPDSVKSECATELLCSVSAVGRENILLYDKAAVVASTIGRVLSHTAELDSHDTQNTNMLRRYDNSLANGRNAAGPSDLILSLDGDGCTSYADLLMLQALSLEIIKLELQGSGIDSAAAEQELQDLVADFRPCDFFSFIAGKNAGGLIAIMLGRLHMSLGDSITSFEQWWAERPEQRSKLSRAILTFNKLMPQYDYAGYAKLFGAQVNAEFRLRDQGLSCTNLKGCKTMVAVSDGLNQQYFIRSYSQQAHKLVQPEDKNPAASGDMSIRAVAGKAMLGSAPPLGSIPTTEQGSIRGGQQLFHSLGELAHIEVDRVQNISGKRNGVIFQVHLGPTPTPQGRSLARPQVRSEIRFRTSEFLARYDPLPVVGSDNIGLFFEVDPTSTLLHVRVEIEKLLRGDPFFYHTLEKCARTILKYWRQAHRDPCRIAMSLANVYFKKGRYLEAEKIYRLALDGRVKELPKSHSLVWEGIDKLVQAMCKCGHYRAAEEVCRRTLDEREREFGLKHHRTLTAANNFGEVLWRRGKYEAAEELCRRALEGREKSLGPEHPDTLTSLNNLAMVLRGRGKYEAAEEMCRRALEGREKALGPELPDTLTSLNNLATVLWQRCKYETAEEMCRRALEGREKSLGPTHPDTLTSLNNLATVLQRRGKYEAAWEMCRRALEGREKSLGPEHPDTLTNLNSLATLLHGRGKYEAAWEMYRRALKGSEKVLGLEHPDTLTSLNNLATVLQGRGEYEAAEEMCRRALEGRKKVLGPKHPRTLTSATALASILKERATDRRQDA